MSRRPGGARKKVAKQEPLVSEAWGTLATTTISMLETVAAVNEDASEDCIEEAAQLSEMNKKRMGFQSRMELLDAVTQMIEGFIGALADLDAEQREEHGVAELFENLYGAMFSIITESIEGVNKESAPAKQKEELSQQIALTLRAIDVLIASSFDNDAESALTYLKPFLKPLLELCCTQLGVNTSYAFFVRQMAIGLLTELIESKNLNALLVEAEHKEFVDLIINTCFTLCADAEDAKREEGGAADEEDKPKKGGDDDDEEEEEEDEEGKSLDPSEETSQNLGTQLLDTLTASLPVSAESEDSFAAPLILAKARTILNDAASSKLDKKAALVCLAVLPEAAHSFAQKAEYLEEVLPLLQRFLQADGNESLVRSGAFIALSEHVEHLQPEIAPFNEKALDAIVAALKDPLEKSNLLVKLKATIPLQQLATVVDLPARFLASDSEDNLVKFLLAQIKALSAQSVEERSQDGHDLLQSVVASLSNLALTYVEEVADKAKPGQEAPKNYLAPFVAEAFELLLQEAEKATDEEVWGLRGDALQAVSRLARAQDKAATVAALPRLSKVLLDTYDLEPEEAEEDGSLPDELFELRGQVHNAWAFLLKQLGDEAVPFVEPLVDNIVRCLEGSYGEKEEEEPEDEDGDMMMGGEGQANQANNERQYALLLYQHLLETLGPKMVAHQPRVFTVVFDNASKYSPEVQVQLVYAVSAMTNLHPLPEGVTPQAGVDAAVSAEGKELLLKVKDLLMDYMQHAVDPDVVEAALDALTAITNTYGQVVVNDAPKTLSTMQKFAKKLLGGSAVCQSMSANEVAYFNPSEMLGGFGGDDDEAGEEEEEEGLEEGLELEEEEEGKSRASLVEAAATEV